MKLHYIYTRTSTREGQSPELQIRDILTLNPPPDVNILTEQLSAWNENVNRPEFESLLLQIKAGKVASLYVWGLDRIYRNRKRLIEFLALCKAFGVKVHSYNQKWLDSINQIPAPWNEMVFDLMLQIVGWMAEEESVVKSNRVKMAVNKKAAGTFSHNGKKWGRSGLSTQTINKVKKLHREGKTMREIAAMVKIYDSNKNSRQISKSAVHKIIGKKAPEKDSKIGCP